MCVSGNSLLSMWIREIWFYTGICLHMHSEIPEDFIMCDRGGKNRDKRHGWEGVFSAAFLYSGFWTMWKYDLFLKTHIQILKIEKSIHRCFQCLLVSLYVSLCISETGESGSEFSHFSIDTNVMQLKTPPPQWLFQGNSLPLEKAGRQKKLDYYSLKWNW